MKKKVLDTKECLFASIEKVNYKIYLIDKYLSTEFQSGNLFEPK